MLEQENTTKELILVGGGHSHCIFLRNYKKHPIAKLKITLISDVDFALYSGMLPGHLAGIYSFAESHIDLKALCEVSKISFLNIKVNGIDLENKKILCENGSAYSYDILSINTGILTKRGISGDLTDNSAPVKPVQNLLMQWNKLRNTKDFVIVGGGAGGVEVALAIRARFGKNVKISIIHSGKEILAESNKTVQLLTNKVLKEKNVDVFLNSLVTKVNVGEIYYNDEFKIKSDFTIWASGASAPDWIKYSGLELDSKGFIAVTDILQSTSHNSVYAAGDIASVANQPRPKSGVFAVRQGDFLYKHFLRLSKNDRISGIKLQKNFLSLIGTSDGRAIGSYAILGWIGKYNWKLKDWIDRKFVKSFKNL